MREIPLPGTPPQPLLETSGHSPDSKQTDRHRAHKTTVSDTEIGRGGAGGGHR